MKVGFTGTQHGMSAKQRLALSILLQKLKPTEFHHGDCIGADAEAHSIALALGVPIVVHPPLNPDRRAFCVHASAWREPRPYLDRNRDIVNDTFVLIAAPMSDTMRVRSGTWATWRYAKTLGRDIRLLSR